MWYPPAAQPSCSEDISAHRAVPRSPSKPRLRPTRKIYCDANWADFWHKKWWKSESQKICISELMSKTMNGGNHWPAYNWHFLAAYFKNLVLRILKLRTHLNLASQEQNRNPKSRWKRHFFDHLLRVASETKETKGHWTSPLDSWPGYQVLARSLAPGHPLPANPPKSAAALPPPSRKWIDTDRCVKMCMSLYTYIMCFVIYRYICMYRHVYIYMCVCVLIHMYNAVWYNAT